MDLDYLHMREQAERLRAATAASTDARAAHAQLAGLFRDRIERREAADSVLHSPAR